MKTKSIYVTVKLDIEYQENLDFEEVKQKVLSEMDYDFRYWEIENEEVKFGIINTEIYGQYQD